MIRLMEWRKSFLFGLLVLLLVNTGCNQQSKQAAHDGDQLRGNISISGAFAMYPITVKWAEEFRKIHPDVRIDISAGGAGKGMADAMAGMVDLGMFSRGISPSEKEQGVWWIAVTKDAVLPTISASNPYLGELGKTGISQESFIEIFVEGKIKTWEECMHLPGNDNKINVYTRSDACGAAQMWAEYLGSNQESLLGIGVYGDPGIADAIKNDRLGLGYNNVVYVFDINSRKKYKGLEVVPIDLNDNGKIDEDELFYDSLDQVMAAIAENRYPSPPARELYFVAAGKPKNMAVTAFLNWILTEGQQFVPEAGYVRLTENTIQKEREKLSHE